MFVNELRLNEGYRIIKETFSGVVESKKDKGYPGEQEIICRPTPWYVTEDTRLTSTNSVPTKEKVFIITIGKGAL